MKRALLVIDVQNEYFTGKMPVSYPQGSLSNIIKVIDTANENKIPEIVIQHTASKQNAETFVKGTVEWELHSSIKDKPRDLLIEKKLPGSFTGTNLEQWLRERNIDTVVIAGYMTQMCCDTTSRQAMHMGFKVEFLSDATGTLSFTNSAGTVTGEELHKTVLVIQAMGFSKVISTSQWIDEVKSEIM